MHNSALGSLASALARVSGFIDFSAEVFGIAPSWEKKLKIKLP